MGGIPIQPASLVCNLRAVRFFLETVSESHKFFVPLFQGPFTCLDHTTRFIIPLTLPLL